MKFSTKKELREKVNNSKSLYIEFNCGLIFRKQTASKIIYTEQTEELSEEIFLTREHDYHEHKYNRYSTTEQFITAAWAKIKRQGQILELR